METRVLLLPTVCSRWLSWTTTISIMKSRITVESSWITVTFLPVRRKPIISRSLPITTSDDFGDGGTKYPLFWVKYDDLAPFLAKQQMMTSNLNNAAVMSVDDYFIRTQYKGKIYKTNNMLGKTLAQYCPNDSAMTKEQKRIEAELAAFEKNIWGNQAKKDSLDSIANAANAVKGKAKVKNRRAGGSSSVRASKSASVKTRRPKSSSSSSNGSARVTVRRERH